MFSKLSRPINRTILNANILKNKKILTINPNIQKQYYSVLKTDNNKEISQENFELKHYLKNVYYKTGLGITGSLATASTLTYLAPEFLSQNALGLLIVGAIGAIGSIFAYRQNDYTTRKENYDGKLVTVTEHSTRNKLAYGVLSVSNGLTIAPLVLISSAVNPLILPTALVLSAGTMGGASWYALSKKNSDINLWGPTLYGGLIGMVGMGLVSLVTIPFFPQFAYMWFTFEPYLGIALFSALTAYDTHMAVSNFKEGNRNDLDCAISFFLNFMNLLIRFMEILMRLQRKG